MALQKGHKIGNRFSRENQPRNPGRKPSRLNEFSKAFNLIDEDRKISKEDTFKLLEYLLSCSKADIEKMLRNPDLPIAIICQIKAIVDDLSRGKCETVFKLYDRLYGKTIQSMELPTSKEIPNIPKGPFSRLEYMKLLKKLQAGDALG